MFTYGVEFRACIADFHSAVNYWLFAHEPLSLNPSAEKRAVRASLNARVSRGGSRQGSKMSLRVWLLAVLAACLRFGNAERDPLPVALAELVKSGSVSSAEDLELLLLSDSVGKSAAPTLESRPPPSAFSDVDAESYHGNSTNNRLPRSLLDAQPAQQALCKVRTEVMEVTRSMLDRSNAHFLLWPPCVEVQRCSGCCNTKSLKCVPVLTHTRYLQVMKIQYANKRPVYDKAVVSVSDHVECRCQPAPRPGPRRKSPAQKQEVKDHTGKPRYKDELHHQDELKHNQRLRLEDLLSHSWPPREELTDSVMSTGFLPSDGQELHSGNEDWSHNKTEHRRSKGHYHGDGRKYNGSSSGTRGGSSERLTTALPNHTERDKPEESLALHNVTRAGVSQRQKEQLHMDNVELVIEKNTIMLINQTYRNGFNPTEMTSVSSFQTQNDQNLKHSDSPARPTSQTYIPAPRPKQGTNQKRGDVFSQAKEPSERLQGNEAPESGRTLEEIEGRRGSSTLLKEKEALEEEKEELLLLHKLLDDEKQKHLLKTQHSDEEEQRQYRPLHKHQHIYTTTQQTESTSSPAKVSAPRTHPRTPPRPPHRPPHRTSSQTSKKWRKQRNRISKAAMRAMLM